MIVCNLAVNAAPKLQFVNLGRHNYKSLVRDAMFNFNLGTLKKFATVGLHMHERTFNRLLINSVAKLQRGEGTDDFVNTIINKWYALTIESSIDEVVDMTVENLFRALTAVSYRVIGNYQLR